MDELTVNPRRLKLVASSSRALEFHVFESRIADYVAGDLAADAQDAFEEALLANPDWAQWVEAEEMLRAGIRSLAINEPKLFTDAAEARPSARPAAVERRPHRAQRWVSGLALAATAMFAALFVNARQQVADLQSALSSAQAPRAEVEFIRLDEMRGIAASADAHTLPAQTATVVLEIPAGPTPLSAYRVRLLRDEEIIWDLSPARADAEGLLLISVPGAKLMPGKYRAVLSATSELAIPVSSYEFTLAKP